MNAINRDVLYNGVVQVFQYIVPIVTVPYLIRVVGIENYGLLAYSIAILGYANIISQFGFSLTATAEIAKNRTNKAWVSQYLVSIYSAKVILVSVSLLLTLLTMYLLNTSQDTLVITMICSAFIVFNNLMPNWFFQGIGAMKNYGAYIISGRLVYLILLLSFVNDEKDLYLAAMLQSIPGAIVTFFSFLYMNRNGYLKTIKFNFFKAIIEIRNSYSIFVSSFSVGAYHTSLPVVIGSVLGEKILGYYSVADMIRKVLVQLYSPIYQSVYPKINSIIETDFKASKLIIIKYFLLSLFSALILVLVLEFLKSDIILKVMSEHRVEVENVLSIMLVTVITGVLVNFSGVQTLLPLGYKKEFSKVVFLSIFISLLAIYPMVNIWGLNGAGISMLTNDILLIIMLTFVHAKNKTWLNTK